MSNMQATLRALLGRVPTLAELAALNQQTALRDHAFKQIRHRDFV